MLQKLKKRYEDIDLCDLENVIVLICFLIFSITLFLVNNIIVIFFLNILVFFLSNFFKSKDIRFINSILPILIIGYFLFSLTNFTIIEYNFLNTLLIVIKVFLFINYTLFMIELLKKKKVKILKTFRRRFKYYSFKELRNRNIEYFNNLNKNNINNYIIEHDILENSDYYKVINDNLENKSKNDLEEYVWVNYLRFYKNKRYHMRKVFEKINFVFLIIHGIILLLAMFVR